MSSDYKITDIESSEVKKIFLPQCLEFVIDLHNLFNSKRIHLLEERKKIQQKIDSGWMPDFLEETRTIRESDWTILSTPDDLLDRRVEITAPPARKMIINALKMIDLVYVMTMGGPRGGTRVIGYSVFVEMFAYGKIGYGSAIGVILLILILPIILYQLRQLRRQL